jgi:hypothetical protein
VSFASLSPAPMNKNSGSFRTIETICQELLTRLQGDDSEQAKAYVAQVHALLDHGGRSTVEPPSQEQRSSLITRILDLHRTTMNYVLQRDHKPLPKGT